MLELVPTVSNTNNFSLERDNERPIVLRPRSQIEVPIHFMPSTLGQGDHIARIIFHSEQVSTKHVIHVGLFNKIVCCVHLLIISIINMI
jgi:hypothetical protein